MLKKGMAIERNLEKASRESLLALISEQQATIDELKQRVGELEARLNSRGASGMPGNKS